VSTVRVSKKQPSMNNAGLDPIIRRLSSSVEGEHGRWSFRVNGVELMVLTDETHNRMRIMTPVTDAAQSPTETL